MANLNPPDHCIWIELRPFAPKSPFYGYIIIHTANGTVINGSSEEWLNKAVERFIKLTRVRNGRREAKFGLATNYDWVE